MKAKRKMEAYMNFIPHNNRYPGGRNPVFASGGMVCTSQPQAAQAGLEILKKGGNAVDAAIATAAALTVTEPTSNGIGGDAFALVWKDGRIHGLNSSGPAPELLSLSALKNRSAISRYGWEAVTVPGVPAAWAALSGKFGKLEFASLIEPAIKLARDGFSVSPTVAFYWKKAFARYSEVLKEEQFRHWFETFAPGMSTPAAGQLWSNSAQAASLEAIAASFAMDFYNGRLADTIDSFSKETGGYLRKTDLEKFRAEWVEPVSVRYRDYDVWEIPPNGHGMVALQALGMLAGDDMGGMDADSLHLQIEAIKLGFADAHAYIAEPGYMPWDTATLLDEKYLAGRRSLIGKNADIYRAGKPQAGGTVYLATADASGCMVSYIQSNYMGFGSGLVVPGTGIALHNRGHNFSIAEGHPNCLMPGKRPYHTIIPGFLTRDDKPVGPFGVMGGFMQPQGHLQTLIHSIDEGCHPQEALDAPRFMWEKDRTVHVEKEYGQEIISELRARGHEIIISEDQGLFGRGQIIWRDKNGVLCGGTEKRCDGTIASF